MGNKTGNKTGTNGNTNTFTPSGMGSGVGSTCYKINMCITNQPQTPKQIYQQVTQQNPGTPITLGRVTNHLQWLKQRGCVVNQPGFGWVTTGYNGVGVKRTPVTPQPGTPTTPTNNTQTP